MTKGAKPVEKKPAAKEPDSKPTGLPGEEPKYTPVAVHPSNKLMKNWNEVIKKEQSIARIYDKYRLDLHHCMGS